MLIYTPIEGRVAGGNTWLHKQLFTGALSAVGIPIQEYPVASRIRRSELFPHIHVSSDARYNRGAPLFF